MKRGRKKGLGNGRNTAMIDSVIKKYYKDHGPDFVAKKVGETREYIQSRAWTLKIRTTKKRTPKPKKKTKNEIIKELQEQNHILRGDNIRLVQENKRLKRRIILPKMDVVS
jgi:hypothetical protein